MKINEKRIYMDYAATAPVDPQVVSAMLPYYSSEYGNPSSAYAEGVRARRALEDARERIAYLIGARPQEIYFTSGGTESDNWAIRGVCAAIQGNRREIVTSRIEHSAVSRTCEAMESQGVSLCWNPVGRDGRIDLQALEKNITERTALVTLMSANHETGVLQPVREAAAMAHRCGAYLLSDAVQAAATQALNVRDSGVDLLSVSGHKLGTPRGIGFLYIRQGVRCAPLLTGGGQERGGRSGTESVAAAVGLARAMELAEERRVSSERVRALAQQMVTRFSKIPGCTVHGWKDSDAQLPGTVCVSFDCVEGVSLVGWLDRHGICVSAGSACSMHGTTEGKRAPSEVLLSMGATTTEALSAVRFSLSWQHDEKDVENTLFWTLEGVRRLREMDDVGSSRYAVLG